MKSLFLSIAAIAALGASAQVNVEVYPDHQVGREVTAVEPAAVVDGEWAIYTLRGSRVTGEEAPTLTIADGKFYGNNGCNVINGKVAIDPAKSKITFSDLVSSRMYCQNAPFEYQINTTLPEVRSFKLTRYGREYYLDLQNAKGHNVMTLRKHNMDFLNGAWGVAEIAGEPNSNEAVRIVIDLPEQRLHGNAGCNIVNGTAAVNPDVANSISFTNLFTTMMACPEMANETKFLVALEEAHTAYANPDGSVSVRDNHGRQVLLLKPLVGVTSIDD